MLTKKNGKRDKRSLKGSIRTAKQKRASAKRKKSK
tara:strand:+ start:126 stop:230 length:105 start_codon:yes stop_codon:yes gene_type:complete